MRKHKKKLAASDNMVYPTASCSSSSSGCTLPFCTQRGVRVSGGRRSPRILSGSVRPKESEIKALALPLGMSIAAFVAQVLERKDATEQKISVEHLPVICSLAVRESLTNVFGNKFDCFVRNFEKSFRSTLMTLIVINESSQTNGRRHQAYLNGETCYLDHAVGVSINSRGPLCHSDANDCQSEAVSGIVQNQERLSTFQEIEETTTDLTAHGLTLRDSQASECLSAIPQSMQQPSVNKSMLSMPMNSSHPCYSLATDCQSDALKTVHDQEILSTFKDIEDSGMTHLTIQQLALHDGQESQRLALVPRSTQHSVIKQSTLTTLEKCIIEQARSNNLKTLEIGLTMKKLQMKERQLFLDSDSNFLERCKLQFGFSKASFKAEKYKNELKDARLIELLKTCMDCLVAGVFIMLASVGYGAYVYSHRRITEATAPCAPTKESSSWWIPKPMSSFNSGFQMISCYVQVMSRMLFGVLMILTVFYLILQRSTMSQQAMPITFLLLLLGGFCGFAGKVCLDTLGGDGYLWFIFWEILCALHFFAMKCTCVLFSILNGPIQVSEKARHRMIFPYWARQFIFYATVLLFLPLYGGLMPFASPAEWKEHFSSLAADLFLAETD